ncbi:hypothetical protein ACU6TU_09805 [Halomonas sp. LS-001]
MLVPLGIVVIERLGSLHRVLESGVNNFIGYRKTGDEFRIDWRKSVMDLLAAHEA